MLPSRILTTCNKILFFFLIIGIFLFSPQTAHADTKEVYILDFQFNPQVVIISPGDTIKWTNKDTVPHTATSDSQNGSDAWDSGSLDTGKSYSKTFTTPGTYAYHCTFHPNMQSIIQVGTTVTIPTPGDTSMEMPTDMPTSEPMTQPTTQPAAQSTTLSLTVFLDSIGQGGDSMNKTSPGNVSPKRTQRNVSYTLMDTNNMMITGQTQLTYSAANGNFTGTATLDGITSGNYKITLKVDGFLENSQTQSISAGQTLAIPPLHVIAGDITNDNQLNALDYNVLITCYGTSMTTPACMDSQASDINDDGMIDGVDYNIFLRELSGLSHL